MKKLYLASALATVLTLSSNAMAIDSTGCGLGSMAWRGQSGTAPQILAVTTNGSFGTQTFGILPVLRAVIRTAALPAERREWF